MSSTKTGKCSSTSSLTKLISRISRTLSFTSKKSQQTLKNNNKKVKPIEPMIKNVNFAPKSAPVIRRHPPQPISKMLYYENTKKEGHFTPIIYRNIYVDSKIQEEDDDDYSRYSLEANLSLFNISTENFNCQSHDDDIPIPRHDNWLDEIFHSTKIDDS